MLAAVEVSPDICDMVDPAGKRYGMIEIRRTVDGIRYRAVHHAGDGDRLLGWGTSLRLAGEHVHRACVSAMSPASGPNEGWPAHPSRSDLR